MTKQQRKLLWELFLMVREVMPANDRRLAEWAQRFHERERELEASDADD